MHSFAVGSVSNTYLEVKLRIQVTIFRYLPCSTLLVGISMNDSMFALENNFGNDETQGLETMVGRAATGLGRGMAGVSGSQQKVKRPK